MVPSFRTAEEVLKCGRRDCERSQQRMHAWVTATNSSDSRGAVWVPGRGCGCSPVPHSTAGPERHHPPRAGGSTDGGSGASGERRRGRTLGGAERRAPGTGGGPEQAGLRAALGTHAQTGRGARRHRGGGARKGGVERISALADK